MAEVRDHLPDLLKDWAQWYETAASAGYAGSTTIWRAMYAQLSGTGYHSQIPVGVDDLRTTGAMSRLIAAMHELLQDEDARESVIVVQGHYLVGPEQVKSVTGWSRAKIYQVVNIGEALIRREMKLR